MRISTFAYSDDRSSFYDVFSMVVLVDYCNQITFDSLLRSHFSRISLKCELLLQDKCSELVEHVTLVILTSNRIRSSSLI